MGQQMKKHLIAAAVLAATVTAAEAKCSTAAMNGNWVYGLYTSPGLPVVFNNGSIILGGMVIGTFTMPASCRGAALIHGIPARITAERIDKDSTSKPNLANISADLGGGNYQTVELIRQ